jgi:hypothetical protein
MKAIETISEENKIEFSGENQEVWGPDSSNPVTNGKKLK